MDSFNQVNILKGTLMDQKRKKRSINRLMDKDEVVYVPNGIEASGTK